MRTLLFAFLLGACGGNVAIPSDPPTKQISPPPQPDMTSACVDLETQVANCPCGNSLADPDAYTGADGCPMIDCEASCVTSCSLELDRTDCKTACAFEISQDPYGSACVTAGQSSCGCTYVGDECTFGTATFRCSQSTGQQAQWTPTPIMAPM